MVGEGEGGRLANATASACHNRHAIGQVEMRHGTILSAAMDFDHSPKVKALQKKLDVFMGEFIYPNQQRYREQTANDDRWGPSPLIEGRKWWTSGAMDPRCQLLIFMGKTDPENPDRHRQQSMVLVPRDAPGVTILRWLPVFGFDDAPHGHAEVDFVNVRVPAANILLGEGRGFEIAQARLGPGRIHHCMRLIGLAEMGLELMCKRVSSRVAFGKPLAQQSVWLERIAEARILIDEARLLTLNAAYRMDTAGNKAARAEIAMIKVAAPNMLCTILDWAIQAHGAAGVSDDFPLAQAYAYARAVRIVDGPDEVHRNQIGRLELGKY